VRAGGGYPQPWTRDASVNSWNATSLLDTVSHDAGDSGSINLDWPEFHG
jgi:hypothetical protein